VQLKTKIVFFQGGQKSLTNFTIQLKIINCQEKCELILFDGYIHNFFLYTQRNSMWALCVARRTQRNSMWAPCVARRTQRTSVWAPCVARRTSSPNSNSSHVRASMPLLIVVMTSLIRVYRSSTPVTLEA
jgi:hypothetical protein